MSETLENAKMFTQDTQYTKENIQSFEATFGRGFMSAGGLQTCVEMSTILKPVLEREGGAKMLDIGCGIGGAGFYFAETFGAHVHGVDINAIGIEMANEVAKDGVKKGSVKFETMDATQSEFEEGSLDIIYSRDAVLHLPNDVKLDLFKKCLKWLTPGGMILIADYSIGPKSAETLSPDFEAYLKKRGYHLFTPEGFKKCFVEAGFDQELVGAEDKALWYCRTCQREIDNVVLPGPGRDNFLASFSQQQLDDLQKTYDNKIKLTLRGDRSYVMAHATKDDPFYSLRKQVVDVYNLMSRDNYIMSCDGNVSARADDESFLVTPSGVMIPDLRAEMVVRCSNNGKAFPGEKYKPSSESGLHDAIYRNRPDVGGIVHSHSIYACALASCRLPLPPTHYAVCELLGELDFSAPGGGSTAINPDDLTVLCTGYHTYGSRALSQACLKDLGKNKAVLLANHGAVVVGSDLEDAMYNCERLERECEIYWRSIQLSSVAPPKPLTLKEVMQLMMADSGYGQGKESVPDEELDAVQA
mmetsp:Transcript_16395/g.25019  ORF Transcript_16395/g.25019 Transcript_16395/m.25019 type:complete len:528 (+) Transcript_16395:33-1616(+)|eukprot:CAMPEP_0118696898 /NCGR_PEP_ID=MMETSP0800-20121206/14143_1 /TAXON_ID=210618 ORGANISM="Striatella unipunctata, Strain CCMP2910" /NCGR_SAMPLE_ID=MMETSP0800 /ASSEMBLY_ACC=CAM_ASM_000638 /LENGTH=527 /DNA_ID=CAMNT_0006596143 /DNA_START=50 /DNA_END=1633 /DNA_ORIENTATION=+